MDQETSEDYIAAPNFEELCLLLGDNVMYRIRSWENKIYFDVMIHKQFHPNAWLYEGSVEGWFVVTSDESFVEAQAVMIHKMVNNRLLFAKDLIERINLLK